MSSYYNRYEGYYSHLLRSRLLVIERYARLVCPSENQHGIAKAVKAVT